MITGKTITDEEISRLQRWAKRLVEECNLAINLPPGFDRDQWRARCAEILIVRQEHKL